jgi:transposase-like protein
MAKRYSSEIKSEVLNKVRNGKKVSVVAREYGINEMTVRTWLERETQGSGKEVLELSRLRRENEALYRIVGQLTFEAEMEKKNRRRGRVS